MAWRYLGKERVWEEPGLIYEYIEVDQVSEIKPLPERYRISLPDEFTPVWNQINDACHKYYKEVKMPYCWREMGR